MCSLSEEDRQAYALVEAALQNQPLQKAPTAFAADVLARIKAQATPRPTFRLDWLDLVICGLLSGMVGTVFFVWQIVSTAQMAPLRAALRSQGLLFRQQMAFVWQMQLAWPLLALGGLIALALVLGILRAGVLAAK